MEQEIVISKHQHVITFFGLEVREELDINTWIVVLVWDPEGGQIA